MVAAISCSFGELSEEHAVIGEPHHNSEGAPTDPELVGQRQHHDLHDHQPHIGQNESIPESVVEQENSLSEENNSSFHDQNHDDHQEHDPEHDPHYPEEFTDSIA